MDEFGYDVDKKIASELKGSLTQKEDSEISSDTYKTFKQEQKDQFLLTNLYEKYCSLAKTYFGFATLGKKSNQRIADEIEIGNLNVEPKGVIAATFFTQILSLLCAIPLLIIGFSNMAFFIVGSGTFLAVVIFTYPGYFAEITKIKAQQESLLAILYMTIYMRVNPIVENAMFFATQHLSGPLGADLKQCLWLIDNEKVGSIDEAIQHFIPLWLKRNKDFVKSILTLYNVLEQPDTENQYRILDKSLDTILSSTYENMKHYSHKLKMPIVLLHTFGLMFPLIILIAFPMLSIFMAESVKVSYLFFGYIIVLPMRRYFFSGRIISNRPGAFSFPDVSKNPFMPPKNRFAYKAGNKTYLIPVPIIAFVIGMIIMSPGIYHLATSSFPLYQEMSKENPHGTNKVPKALLEKEYKVESIITTLTIPIGLGIALALFFYFRSIQKIKLRDEIIEIEDDLGTVLFQFSNQFTEDVPIEQAVENFVTQYSMLNLKKRSIFNFFNAVLGRMQQEGVTFGNAIFQDKYGIIIRYPSVLLKEICWIIVEGVKKGSKIVFNIINKVSIYLDNVRKIKELIYDLLTDTVSSINLQAKILTPFIAAIVGSLTLVIINVLYKMSQQLEEIMNNLNLGMIGGTDQTSFFTELFNFSHIMPPTIFQVLVGIYMVETVYLLSVLANGVENGFDSTSRDVTIGRNLLMAVVVYAMITIIGSYALNTLITTSSGLIA